MRKDNIFKFGGQVYGESFLGRHKAISDVSDLLQVHSGSKGVAIIGLNRIGKTSLVNKVTGEVCAGREGLLLLREDVNTKSGANLFWHRLAMDLQDTISSMEIEDKAISDSFQNLFSSNVDSSIWFSSYLDRNLRIIFRRLHTLGFRVMLVLDEFDKAMDLFKEEPGSLGVIRNLASSAEYAVTVITISRRKLHVIEQSADPTASTLDGVFEKYHLTAFDSDDMSEYWGALTDYDIFPDNAMRDRLFQLAGTHPYLLSLFANRMVEKKIAGEIVDANTLDEIHHMEYDRNIRDYYDTLITRMKEDGYAAKLRGALCGLTYGITDADITGYRSGGYLNVGMQGYYIISQEFTQYFLEHTKDIYLPVWDSIMTAERTLKSQVRAVYPQLGELRYSMLEGKPEWPNEIKNFYPEIRLSKEIIERNMKKNKIEYGQDSSIIDVLDLKYVVEAIIQPNWANFQGFFEGKAYAEWETPLKLLVRARTPLAHDHPEYLTETENNLLPVYCQQIVELNVSK